MVLIIQTTVVLIVPARFSGGVNDLSKVFQWLLSMFFFCRDNNYPRSLFTAVLIISARCYGSGYCSNEVFR